jgi:uncharacterized metal-binding protein
VSPFPSRSKAERIALSEGDLDVAACTGLATVGVAAESTAEELATVGVAALTVILGCVIATADGPSLGAL